MSDLLKRLRGRFELSDALYRLNNEAADALEAQQAEIERLRKALGVAVRQNEHDMVMTGEEIRECRAAIDAAKESTGAIPYRRCLSRLGLNGARLDGLPRTPPNRCAPTH